jgi:putative tricarboxylic transport membrane protein
VIRRHGLLASRLACLAVLAWCQSAAAQEIWKPTRPVTLIAPNAPGGTSDRTARQIQRIIQQHRLVEVPVNVVNRPGGSGTIALNQLHAHPGDGHVLQIATSSTLSAHITGLTPYGHADFTPLSVMMQEYFGVNVRAASPVTSARDMLERLRKSPDSLSFGTSSIAGNNFTSLASALKKAGLDVKQIKTVSFAGGGQITLALLGGHIDVVSTGLSNAVEHLQQGKIRTLVVTGPRRMWGPYASVPTWKEVGVDIVETSWRGVMGAKDLRPAQIAYWDGVFRKLVETEEWKKEVQDNYWENTYVGASETRRRLDQEYAELKQILTDLGMAK